VYCWVCVNAAVLRWAFVDPDSAVFNGETGETHILSALPAYTLQLLQRCGRTTNEVRQETAKVCETANNRAWHRKTVAILRNLESLELIERYTVSHAPTTKQR